MPSLEAPPALPPPPATGGPALYVNYFELGHNPFEFLIELGQFRPAAADGAAATAIHTRIAMAPSYAKMLSRLLDRAVREHEGEYGAIAPIEGPASPFDIVLRSLPEFEARARALRACGDDQPIPDPVSR